MVCMNWILIQLLLQISSTTLYIFFFLHLCQIYFLHLLHMFPFILSDPSTFIFLNSVYVWDIEEFPMQDILDVYFSRKLTRLCGSDSLILEFINLWLANLSVYQSLIYDKSSTINLLVVTRFKTFPLSNKTILEIIKQDHYHFHIVLIRYFNNSLRNQVSQVSFNFISNFICPSGSSTKIL